MTKILKSGDLAYWDCLFNGVVKIKIISIEGETYEPNSSQKITFKVTANKGAYKKNEILYDSGLHIFPRSSLRITKYGYYRIKNDFIIQGDSDNANNQ